MITIEQYINNYKNAKQSYKGYKPFLTMYKQFREDIVYLNKILEEETGQVWYEAEEDFLYGVANFIQICSDGFIVLIDDFGEKEEYF